MIECSNRERGVRDEWSPMPAITFFSRPDSVASTLAGWMTGGLSSVTPGGTCSGLAIILTHSPFTGVLMYLNAREASPVEKIRGLFRGNSGDGTQQDNTRVKCA